MKSSTKQAPAERALALIVLAVGHFAVGWALYMATVVLFLMAAGSVYLAAAVPVVMVALWALWPLSTALTSQVSFGSLALIKGLESLLFAALVLAAATWFRSAPRRV